MKSQILVLLMLGLVAFATAYPQSRVNNRKYKLKSGRQDSAPENAPVKPVTLSGSDKVVTVVGNSTPAVVVSTESSKGPEVTTVAPGGKTSPSPVPPPRPPRPVNGTEDGGEEDDDSSSEEEDADAEAEAGDEEANEEGDDEEEDDDDEEEDDEEEAAREDAEALKSAKQPAVAPVKPVVAQQDVAQVQENKVPVKSDRRSPEIDAYIPGYVTDQGEVLVPIDTLERGLEYSIIPDVYNDDRNQVFPRQEASPNAVQQESEEDSKSSEEDAVVPVKVSETSVVFTPKTNVSKVVEGKPETSSASESVEDEDEVKAAAVDSDKKPAIGTLPATKPTDEDDEEDVLGERRAFQPPHNYRYIPRYGPMNDVFDGRRLDYPVFQDPYSLRFRSPVNPRGPYYEESSEDLFDDYY